jgi:hypothetical protein
VYLLEHVLEILAFQIPQRLHSGALHLLHVPLNRRHLVVHRHHPAHDMVVPLILRCHKLLEHVIHGIYAVVNNLNAVVQVGKLVLLGLNGSGKDIFKHLRNVVVRRGSALLLVGLWLLVTAGRWLRLADGLFASVGVCGGDDEFVHLEGVRVFGTGGGYAEVIVFGKLNLDKALAP